jgi:hypothetical protein
MQVLDALQAQDLLDNTLVVKTADHGDMGLSHGLRQKNFNFYEESLRVPLVHSNPQLFPNPRITDAMVSHVDFLPTMASLFGATATAPWQGVDYSSAVLDPSTSVQDYMVFTVDDFQSGQQNSPTPRRPTAWSASASSAGSSPSTSTCWAESRACSRCTTAPPIPPRSRTSPTRGYSRTREQERQYVRLRRKLAQVKLTRLASL